MRFIQFEAFSGEQFLHSVQTTLSLRQLGVEDETGEVPRVDGKRRQCKTRKILDIRREDGHIAMGNRITRNFPRAVAQYIVPRAVIIEECDIASPIIVVQMAAAGPHDLPRELFVDSWIPVARQYVQVPGK